MEKVEEFKSKYFDKPFSSELLNSRLLSGIGLFFMTFAFAGLFNFEHNEMKRYNFWNKVLSGLQHMGWLDYLLTFFVAIFVVFLTILILSFKYNERKIIVGLSFNYVNNTLKLRVREVASSHHTDLIIPFSEISLIDERLSDGMTGPTYDCITFKRESVTIGHYYRKHDMWSSASELETEIEDFRTS